MIKPILFVDFDGTICHDKYWRSLPAAQYEKVQQLLFREDTKLVDDWIRGKHTSEEINHVVSREIGVPFDELWELFVHDCVTMHVPQDVLEKLSALRNTYTVMLITGNMDSFSRFTIPALLLERYFDHISNSYYESKHKTDNEGKLFMDYTKKYNVPIKDCAVIDDSKDVCAVFESLGGTAYRITPEKHISSFLTLLEK